MSLRPYASTAEAITAAFGKNVTISGKSRVYGGDINDAFQLRLSNGSTVFMKVNRRHKADFFRAEALGLEALASCGRIRIPAVIAYGNNPEYGAFLLMEYLETGRPDRTYWETFGRQLAELHMADTEEYRIQAGCPFPSAYGFAEDNTIGETRQVNPWKASWLDFYRECRLEFQIKLAQHYFDPHTLRQAASMLDHLDRWIEEPAFPSMLHGDLWSGNALCGRMGEPVLIDPAVYIGHFEADLAMTELFGGFPPAFYNAYKEVNPVPAGYQERRDLYQLYHLLNHLNLFGSAYYGAVTRIIRRYA